jgi:hypothetical protein
VAGFWRHFLDQSRIESAAFRLPVRSQRRNSSGESAVPHLYSTVPPRCSLALPVRPQDGVTKCCVLQHTPTKVVLQKPRESIVYVSRAALHKNGMGRFAGPQGRFCTVFTGGCAGSSVGKKAVGRAIGGGERSPVAPPLYELRAGPAGGWGYGSQAASAWLAGKARLAGERAGRGRTPEIVSSSHIVSRSLVCIWRQLEMKAFLFRASLCGCEKFRGNELPRSLRLLSSRQSLCLSLAQLSLRWDRNHRSYRLPGTTVLDGRLDAGCWWGLDAVGRGVDFVARSSARNFVSCSFTARHSRNQMVKAFPIS